MLRIPSLLGYCSHHFPTLVLALIGRFSELCGVTIDNFNFFLLISQLLLSEKIANQLKNSKLHMGHLFDPAVYTL